ncbi:APOBEC/CMP deaminase zinc-binding [Penicillium robsamsonii]|uniref:APOBEC/CMP deaminase zinc-binding n=1 Tax=Penicillium robsamsonii TaxID=1792511 RepID=UPI002546CD05|nr:APOBEC/CMP deaminase zinc-binding [Penicillium robsamsonii]KAJ5827806.1 APOBEC/CMP deaminase zinc-binding [Penicillium robsamsonii]
MAHTLTAQELTTLSTKAIDAKATAYCPYSKFRVGACILTTSGEFISGANVENASYPVGTCAERVAIGTAVNYLVSLSSGPWLTSPRVAGHKDFKALAVATDIKPPGSPCGMCRQLWVSFSAFFCGWLIGSYSIREFTTPSFPVYMYDGEGNYKVMTMEELLPDSFGPEQLK